VPVVSHARRGRHQRGRQRGRLLEVSTVWSPVGPNPPGKRGRVFSASLATSRVVRRHTQRPVLTSEQTTADNGRTRIVRELQELIAALDRRVPQVERVGELAIARSAATLRDEALRRIATLEREADAIASRFEPIQAPAYIQRRTAGDSNGVE
jgi:hypothetical protein